MRLPRAAHRAAFVAVAVLPLLSACGGEPPLPEGQFAVGTHDAYDRLLKGDLSEFIFTRQCGILIHANAVGEMDRSVTWRITSSGQEMLSFTASLTALGEKRTKIDIAVSKDSSGHEAYDGTQTYRRPALRQPVRPAIEELVASLLEGRSFDIKRVARPMRDTVCDVQRGGLESGVQFNVNDKPGTAARR
ncbi:MAG: hypothetical protein U1E56_00415 [Bauldia sp.]|mgnify:CR=1 FL=1